MYRSCFKYAKVVRPKPPQVMGVPRNSLSSRRFATSEPPHQYEKVDPKYLLEEETLSRYEAKHYYPVKLGEILHERYKVIGKLGYGSASTVWLGRDFHKQPHEYVALKIYINASKYQRELPIYEEINELQTSHEGSKFVRKMHDSFELKGPSGMHTCLVHQPLGMSFDLQPSNMLMGIHDDSVLAEFERFETESPCPRKETDDRTIYMSRPMPLTKGLPAITDLSEARFGDTKHEDCIMPDVYRAPEVILGVPWSYPVDVWGFAMVLWDLCEPKRLFRPQDSEGRYSEAQHLAQMVAIMGPPHQDFLRKCGEKADKYWEKDGTWKNATPIPDTSLERQEQQFEGVEKQRFLAFMRKMLQWEPEDRPDCEALYWDEWLLADLIESGEVVVED